MKSINNTITKGGIQFTKNNTKGGSRTPSRALRSSRLPRKKPPATQQRKRGGLIHQKQHQV
jgi:hypothetical protein